MQNGFHGVLALLAGPGLARRMPLTPPARRTFLVAFTLGNLLPDADWTAVAMVYFADPHLAPHLHRSFTHSLAAALLPLLGFSWLARLTGDREMRAAGWGLSLGVSTHIALDLIGWFSGLDLLWPLGYLGFPSYLNLWAWFELPPLLGRLLGALDYLAYAIYYSFLDGLVRGTGRGTSALPALRRLRSWMGYLTALFLVLGLLLPDFTFNLVHYSIWAVLAYPAALYWTLRLSAAIRAMADSAPPE